jgi:hypothetical protein
VRFQEIAELLVADQFAVRAVLLLADELLAAALLRLLQGRERRAAADGLEEPRPWPPS